MTWISWIALGWFALSSAVALVFGRVLAEREVRESPLPLDRAGRTDRVVVDMFDRMPEPGIR